jgi:hypothetical protein
MESKTIKQYFGFRSGKIKIMFEKKKCKLFDDALSTCDFINKYENIETEKYRVEGSLDIPAISFKQLKTLCYIGDKKIKGGSVYHISTTKKNDKIYELYHNVSKDMLHINIVFQSGKNYLINLFLPKKINGMYTSVLFEKKGSGTQLLSKYEKNHIEIYFDYNRKIYIYYKYDECGDICDRIEFRKRKSVIL